MIRHILLLGIIIMMPKQILADDLPDVATIRLLLSAYEFKEESKTLIGYGERVFPIYQQILTAKDVNSNEISRILGILAAVKADRSRFLEYAVAKLARSDMMTRLSALALLAEIGSARDTPPVVALLADEKWEIPFAAAKTLAAIGDQRALTAMNVWLNSGLHRANAAEYEAQRKHIIKCRDELKTRLDKAKKLPR